MVILSFSVVYVKDKNINEKNAVLIIKKVIVDSTKLKDDDIIKINKNYYK